MGTGRMATGAVVQTPTPSPTPDGPTLYVSYREGAPGSLFTFTGLDYPANEDVSVVTNGHPIATLEAVPGSSNWLIFHLDTAQANEGLYIVLAGTQSVVCTEIFLLDSNEPLRKRIQGPVFDEAPVFLVPAEIAFTSQLFLPFVLRS